MADLPDPDPDNRRFEAYLVLADGGSPTVYLRDGCNVVTGGARIDATSATTGSITMDTVDRTDASCPAPIDQVVDLMSVIQVGTWSYVIDIDRLELTNGARTVVFTAT